MDQPGSTGASARRGVRPAVVVVHGLWMTGAETWLLRRRLCLRGFEAYAFRYRTVRAGLAANADALARWIDDMPARPVHIVGHSLGGVVALEMIERHGPAGIGRIVCVASPLNGSATARSLLGMPGGRGLVGKSMLELDARGGMGPWRHPTVAVGVIAGSWPVGIGRAIGAIGRVSDGTVTLEETRLLGAADHVVRPSSHTSLLFSAAVVDDIVCFLRTGHF